MKPAPLAIIAALDDEIRIIASKMEVDARVHERPARFTAGRFLGAPVVLVRSGIGLPAMEAAAASMIARYRPRLCLHIGCCGGAEPQDQPGDLIIADAVVDSRTGERHPALSDLVERALAACRRTELRCRTAAIVTVEQVISSPHEKAFVGTQHSAAAIDMESAALATACNARGVPWLVVRAVLDSLDVALPTLDDAISVDGTIDGMKLAGMILRRPRILWDLSHLQYFAAEVRMALSRFVEAWIGQEER